MSHRIPIQGTLINTLAVIGGSIIGLIAKQMLDDRLQILVQAGIGLVAFGVGVGMFLKSRNVLFVVGAISLGGILGAVMGIDVGLDRLAEGFRQLVGGEGEFNLGFVTASILYCVGPMTVLGCIQDGVEGKSELLRLKSMLDGISSVFLAAGLGVGVLASAATVLVVQGAMTLLARYLRPIADHPAAMDEASGAGGIMMMAIGLGLAQIKDIPAELFLPALFLAPVVVLLIEKYLPSSRRIEELAEASQEPEDVKSS